MDTEKAAQAFKALGDDNRLRIIELIASQGEMCACRILDELDIAQPTLSHHMKLLKDAGLVKTRKQGRWMHYSMDRSMLESIEGFLRAI